jgi:hypothetical protein
MSDKQIIPAPIPGGGFDGPSLLAPNSLLAKWDADAGWHDRDGLGMPSPVIALGTRRGVRRWKDHEIIDEIVDPPLPDCDELNAAIPESEWEMGPDGNPQRPYSVWHAVYLLNPLKATLYSYLNNTVGASIAVGRLESSLTWMRAMRGNNIFPVIQLADAPMKTRFGMKRRPHFEIVEWRELGGASAPQLEHKPQAVLPSDEQRRAAGFDPDKIEGGLKVKNVKPVTTAEAIGDEMPPWDDDISDVGTKTR